MTDFRPGYRATIGPFGLIGTVVGTDEPLQIVGMETPVEAIPGGERVPKHLVERMHLEKYRLDYLLLQRSLPFDNVRSGGDPPDFRVEKEGEVTGLECTVLAISERRDAYRRFSAVRRALVHASRSSPFANLRGTVVHLTFAGGNSPPPTARTQITAILDLLRSIDPSIPPPAMPGIPPHFVTVDGMTTAQITLVGEARLYGSFAGETGFACELLMATEVRRSRVCDEMERLIRQHDSPGCDQLLVTVGGPDTDGLAYPAEESVAELLIEALRSGAYRPRARLLRRLTVHAWRAGWIAEVPLQQPT